MQERHVEVELVSQSLTQQTLDLAGCDADMLPVPVVAHVEQYVLQVANLGHTGHAEEVVRDRVGGEAALAQVIFTRT